MHQPRDEAVVRSAGVVVDPLDQRRGAVPDTDQGDPDGLYRVTGRPIIGSPAVVSSKMRRRCRPIAGSTISTFRRPLPGRRIRPASAGASGARPTPPLTDDEIAQLLHAGLGDVLVRGRKAAGLRRVYTAR